MVVVAGTSYIRWARVKNPRREKYPHGTFPKGPAMLATCILDEGINTP